MTTQDTAARVKNEIRILRIVLAINAGFFLLEGTAGILSRSLGLSADALDMLADALVYTAAIVASRGSAAGKRRVALFSGILQLVLAVAGFGEVVRRFLGTEEPPEFRTMIVVSLAALVGNAACLVLLKRSRSSEAHIRASTIFTSNDVLINIGVIVAGVLVTLSGSALPDLLVGAIVFLLVTRGALKILALGSRPTAAQ